MPPSLPTLPPHATRGGVAFVAGLVLAVAMLAPAQGGFGPSESTQAGPDLVVRVHNQAGRTIDVVLVVKEGGRVMGNDTVRPGPGQVSTSGFDLEQVGVHTLIASWTFFTPDGPRRQTQEFLLSTANCRGVDFVELAIDARPDPNLSGYHDTADMRGHC